MEKEIWDKKLLCSNLRILNLGHTSMKSESDEVWGNMVMDDRLKYEFDRLS